MSNQREAFEAVVCGHEPVLARRNERGEYARTGINAMWVVWQAGCQYAVEQEKKYQREVEEYVNPPWPEDTDDAN